MKILKTLIAFLLIMSPLALAHAQGGDVTKRFNEAKEAFDNSQYQKTLDLLDAIENEFGKSPRVESLRALTLRDLNRPRDAYFSLLTYFKLTERMNLEGSAAHRALIELRDTLRSQLETDLSVQKENLQAERNKNAERAISETDKRTTQSSMTSEDAMAELEMWNRVKTGTNANDYYLFLKRFPAGSFAKLASAKMNEIGDSEWNEIKKTADPFKYRDYIRKNPNSPFLEQAKQKMDSLTRMAIEWEKVKDSQDPNDLIEFVRAHPMHPNAEEAKKRVSELMWAQIKDSKDPTDFDRYSEQFPNGAFASEAKKASETLSWARVKQSRNPNDIESFLWKYPESSYANEARELALKASVFKFVHWHESEVTWIEVQLEFIDNGIQVTEVKALHDGVGRPNEKHNATIPCNNLKSVQYKTSRQSNPYGRDFIKHLIEFSRREGNKKTYDFGFERELTSRDTVRINKVIESVNTFCKLN